MNEQAEARLTLGALYASVAGVLDGDLFDPQAHELLDEALCERHLGDVVATTIVSLAEELESCCLMLGTVAVTVADGLGADLEAAGGPGPSSALCRLAGRYLQGGLPTVELAVAAMCEAHDADRLRGSCVRVLAAAYTWGARVRRCDPLERIRLLCLNVARD